jgi:hypothetical protein
MNSTKRIHEIKELVATFENKLIDNLENQTKLSAQAKLDLIVEINKIKAALNSLTLEKSKYGPIPNYGYLDSEDEIPFVKTQIILDYLAKETKSKRNGFQLNPVWKSFKNWLKKKYHLEHKSLHIPTVNGVTVIWAGIEYEEMIALTKKFLKEYRK